MEAGRRAGPRTGASEQNRLELDPGPGHEGGRNAEAWGGGGCPWTLKRSPQELEGEEQRSAQGIGESPSLGRGVHGGASQDSRS